MDDFRAAAATALIPEASAILLERGFLSRRYPADPWTAPCGLIVAADELVQPPANPSRPASSIQRGAELAIQLGAKALKLLVLWRAGGEHVEQVELARSFVELAHEKGMVAIVEGIVRGPSEGVRPSAGGPGGRGGTALGRRRHLQGRGPDPWRRRPRRASKP